MDCWREEKNEEHKLISAEYLTKFSADIDLLNTSNNTILFWVSSLCKIMEVKAKQFGFRSFSSVKTNNFWAFPCVGNYKAKQNKCQNIVNWIGSLDGLLHGQVADPVGVPRSHASHGAVGRAPGAGLAGEVALGTLQHLVLRDRVAGRALEDLPQLFRHSGELFCCHCVKF